MSETAISWPHRFIAILLADVAGELVFLGQGEMLGLLTGSSFLHPTQLLPSFALSLLSISIAGFLPSMLVMSIALRRGFPIPSHSNRRRRHRQLLHFDPVCHDL